MWNSGRKIRMLRPNTRGVVVTGASNVTVGSLGEVVNNAMELVEEHIQVHHHQPLPLLRVPDQHQ